MRTVLSGRDFRRLYATRLVSQCGDGLFQIALAAYAFFDPQSRPSAPAVAAAFAALLLPYSLVGPWAGVFLDRWRRRQVLVGANAVRAGLVLALAAVVGAGGPLLLVLGLGLVVVSVNRFFLAALSAALPHVVTYETLVTANSLSTTSGTVAAFAGGGLGYGLRLAFGDAPLGSAALLLVTAAWYVTSALIALTMAKDLLGPDADAPQVRTREALGAVARGMAAGARHVWRRRPAAHALLAIASNRFCYGIATIMMLLLYRNYFHPHAVAAGIGGLALVLGATGVGYFAAAVVTPHATRLMRKQTWAAALLVSGGVVQLVLGLPFREELFVPAAFALGLVAQGLKICVDTIVQQTIDDAYRGRVFSFYDVIFNVSFVSAAAVGAVALPASGKSYPMLLVISIGYAVTGLGYAVASRPRYRTRERGTLTTP